MPKLSGKGHEILALMNQDYFGWDHEFIAELLKHPNQTFTIEITEQLKPNARTAKRDS